MDAKPQPGIIMKRPDEVISLLNDLGSTWAVLRNCKDFMDAEKGLLGEYWKMLDKLMGEVFKTQVELMKCWRSGAAQEVSPEHILRNLLAVIHRDGGHYATEHGLEKAGEDAQALVLKERSEEVSPIGSVQKITGPERPRCPLCGAETTCLSCRQEVSPRRKAMEAAKEIDETCIEQDDFGAQI